MSQHAHTSLGKKHADDKDLSPKKLRKRYHKLEEELADAQDALDEAQEDLKEAQERLQRHERRVQKRTARIQKIKQKLLATQHAIDGDPTSDPELEEDSDITTVTPDTERPDDPAVLKPIAEAPVEPVVVSVDEPLIAEAQTRQEVIAEEQTSEPAVSLPTAEEQSVQQEATAPKLVEEQLEQQVITPEATVAESVPSSANIETLESTPAVSDNGLAGVSDVPFEATLEAVVPDLETTQSEGQEIADVQEMESSEVTEAAIEAPEPVAVLDELPQASFPSLTAPTQESTAAPAYGLRSAASPAERQTDEIVAVRVPKPLRASVPEESTEDTANPIAQDDQESATFAAISSAQEQVVATESQEIIAEANAVAEAAEEAADLAADRLFEFEQRLDHFVSGRHLEQELAQMQAEVERTERFAREARGAVDSVSTQTALVEPTPSPVVQPQADLFDADHTPLELSTPASTETVAPSIESAENLAADPSLEQIDREEEVLEAAVSASINNAAQRRSEQVEAYAEASGARAQEARALVERVSMMVDMVVSAIDSGILTGDNADEAMAAAEQEMSSAQAVLTALEIITERADSYSAETEATAEVSAGMSYASEENWHKDTRVSNDLAEIQHEPA
jgi:hypothetical protein